MPRAARSWPDRRDAITFGALAGTALVGAAFENHADLGALVGRSPLDTAADVGNVYGDGAVLGGAALVLIALGHASEHAALTRAGTDLTSSLIGTWAATWMLKVAIDARRPNGGHYSFPSGHTATAFAAVPVVERHAPAATPVAIALAALTGLGRLEENRHYLADVLVGAAVGLVVGRMVTDTSTLGVTGSGTGIGFGLSLRF